MRVPGLRSTNGRNKNPPDRDTVDTIRKDKERVKESQNPPDRDTADAIRKEAKARVKESQKRVHRSWNTIRFWRKKKNEQTVSVTDQTIELNNISSTGAAQRQQHDSGSTIAGRIDNSHRQKAERGDYSNLTGYDEVKIAGPSNEPTGTKRGSGHSRDGSTKRIKHDDHDPHENELVHAEIREKQLQKKIDILTAAQEDDKAKAAQYIQQWEILQQEVQNIRRSYAAQANELRMVKERAEQETQTNLHAINVFETRLKEVQEENLRVKSTLQEKNGLLAEYRDDIAKLSNERPDSKRDDHYFEQHFSQIFRSIQSWVLQYYLMVNPSLEDSGTSLHPLIREFLQTTAGMDGLAILQSEPVYTIQAYISSQMTVRILRPFLLGLMGDSFERLYNIVAPVSGGEELTKWRMSTVKMCIRREEFAHEVSTKIGEIASELVASLATLLPDSTSPRYKPAPRTRKLKAILEQAAELALEVQQEPSTITYTNIDPTTVCVASHVSDAKGLRSEDDLEASGVRVRLTVYPAVVRTLYNEPQEIVLVKAKVLVLESSDS